MEIASGPEAILVVGTWTAGPDEVELVATTVNGAPATPEEQAPDSLRREGDGLVHYRPDGGPVVWTR